jgi:rhodanese-related sulfurtransferase
MVDRTGRWISPLELHENRSDSTARPLVVDVRSQQDFDAGHIPDAVNIPADKVLESLPRLNTGQPVVLYCDMRHRGSSRSEGAADQLRKAGLQARVLDGGFPAWEAAEYPVSRRSQFHRVGNV